MKQKTHITKGKDIKRDWHFVDFDGNILGRTCTQIAKLLIGKDKPYYTSQLDCGDYVVAVNAKKVKVSGRKSKQKMYYRHSGYPGGFKQRSFEQLISKNPKEIIELAVKGMLPKNKLRSKRMKRLKVFVNSKHPYQDKFSQENSQKKQNN